MKRKHFRGHLSLEERQAIYLMRAKVKSFSEIGKTVCRDRSVIWRELKRNKAPSYLSRELCSLEKAKYAQAKAVARRSESKRGARFLTEASFSEDSHRELLKGVPLQS